ncbi:MAG: hypothetical protein GX606_06295, partial [Elusimicrobia bacterium]|nr:hypothetical protein [Elusimicrobiota bacterium]
MRKILCLFLAVLLALTGTPVQAGGLVLPAPGEMVPFSQAYQAPSLVGIKVYPKEPFRFDFIVDKGNEGKSLGRRQKVVGDGRDPSGNYDDNATAYDLSLKADLLSESTKLIKYFLAALTIPEQDLWVNLSPEEKDRIIPEAFGKTEMGRDLLAQDYLLKQITSSALNPDEALGRRFWDQVYRDAQERFGTTDIPFDTRHRVWIVPDTAEVFEKADVNAAMILKTHLKVMVEEDYLAKKDTGHLTQDTREASAGGALGCQASGIGCPASELSNQVLREVIIPALEKEVNEGENFATLRQVYRAFVLAAWLKGKVAGRALGDVFVDQRKVGGLEGTSRVSSPQQIWQLYVEAFQEGVFNYIREETDAATGEVLPRKYFSGGVVLDGSMTVTTDAAALSLVRPSGLVLMPVAVTPSEVLPSIAQGATHLLAPLDERAPEFRSLQEEEILARAEGERAVVLYSGDLMERLHPEDQERVRDFLRTEQIAVADKRTQTIPLLHPVEVEWNRRQLWLREVSAKGVAFDSRRPLKMYQGPGYYPSPLLARRDGSVERVQGVSIFEGGMAWSFALREFLFSGRLLNAPEFSSAGIMTRFPLGVGKFSGISYHDGQERVEAGFVLYAGMSFQKARETVGMGFLGKAAQAGEVLRTFHEQGIVHDRFHPGNYLLLPNVSVTYDFEDVAGIRHDFASPEQFFAQVFIGLAYAAEKAGRTPDGIGFPVLMEDFLKGYFGEEDYERLRAGQPLFPRLKDLVEPSDVPLLSKADPLVGWMKEHLGSVLEANGSWGADGAQDNGGLLERLRSARKKWLPTGKEKAAQALDIAGHFRSMSLSREGRRTESFALPFGRIDRALRFTAEYHLQTTGIALRLHVTVGERSRPKEVMRFFYDENGVLTLESVFLEDFQGQGIFKQVMALLGRHAQVRHQKVENKETLRVLDATAKGGEQARLAHSLLAVTKMGRGFLPGYMIFWDPQQKEMAGYRLSDPLGTRVAGRVDEWLGQSFLAEKAYWQGPDINVSFDERQRWRGRLPVRRIRSLVAEADRLQAEVISVREHWDSVRRGLRRAPSGTALNMRLHAENMHLFSRTILEGLERQKERLTVLASFADAAESVLDQQGSFGRVPSFGLPQQLHLLMGLRRRDMDQLISSETDLDWQEYVPHGIVGEDEEDRSVTFSNDLFGGGNYFQIFPYMLEMLNWALKGQPPFHPRTALVGGFGYAWQEPVFLRAFGVQKVFGVEMYRRRVAWVAKALALLKRSIPEAADVLSNIELIPESFTSPAMLDHLGPASQDLIVLNNVTIGPYDLKERHAEILFLLLAPGGVMILNGGVDQDFIDYFKGKGTIISGGRGSGLTFRKVDPAFAEGVSTSPVETTDPSEAMRSSVEELEAAMKQPEEILERLATYRRESLARSGVPVGTGADVTPGRLPGVDAAEMQEYQEVFPDPRFSPLDPENFRYYRAIREAVNPHADPWRVVYGGSGVDLVNVLMATMAREVVMVDDHTDIDPDLLPIFLERLKELSKPDAEFLPTERQYLDLKYAYGFAHADTIDEEGLILELRAQGVRYEDVSVGKEKGTAVLRFKKTWPTIGEREHVIYFVRSRITSPESYAPFLRNVFEEGFDAYFQNAGMKIPAHYPRFIDEVAEGLLRKPSGGRVLITDDYIGDMNQWHEVYPLEEALEGYYLSEVALPPDIAKWVEEKFARRKNRGYGWEKSILRLEATGGGDAAEAQDWEREADIVRRSRVRGKASFSREDIETAIGEISWHRPLWLRASDRERFLEGMLRVMEALSLADLDLQEAGQVRLWHRIKNAESRPFVTEEMIRERQKGYDWRRASVYSNGKSLWTWTKYPGQGTVFEVTGEGRFLAYDEYVRMQEAVRNAYDGLDLDAVLDHLRPVPRVLQAVPADPGRVAGYIFDLAAYLLGVDLVEEAPGGNIVLIKNPAAVQGSWRRASPGSDAAQTVSQEHLRRTLHELKNVLQVGGGVLQLLSTEGGGDLEGILHEFDDIQMRLKKASSGTISEDIGGMIVQTFDELDALVRRAEQIPELFSDEYVSLWQWTVDRIEMLKSIFADPEYFMDVTLMDTDLKEVIEDSLAFSHWPNLKVVNLVPSGTMVPVDVVRFEHVLFN